MKRVTSEEIKTIAIIPALHGWWAVFTDGDEARTQSLHPVACWALVEYQWPDASARDVVAMIPSGDGNAGLELCTQIGPPGFTALQFYPQGPGPMAGIGSSDIVLLRPVP